MGLLDILLIPLIIVGWGVLIPDIFGSKEHAGDQPSLKQALGFLIFSIVVMIPLGLWSLSIGISSPMEYHTSVKGGLHGYSLAGIGSFVIALGVGIALRFIKLLKGKMIEGS